jgi:hypothetical protein
MPPGDESDAAVGRSGRAPTSGRRPGALALVAAADAGAEAELRWMVVVVAWRFGPLDAGGGVAASGSVLVGVAVAVARYWGPDPP